MRRRLWVGAALTIPVLVLAMGDMLPGQPLSRVLSPRVNLWLQLLLTAPVVLGCGWPFFARAWASVVNRSPNMFTLIALGVGAAFLYSAASVLVPWAFPAGFASHHGMVDAYFESAAAITVLALLGQVLELRARHSTGEAVRQLLGLTPKTARLVLP